MDGCDIRWCSLGLFHRVPQRSHRVPQREEKGGYAA